MDPGMPHLEIITGFESDPLKSRFLVGEVTVDLALGASS